MCDWAFKHVFGHNENNLLLLLNDLLPEKIVSITYDPNEIDHWKGGDKNIIMDVLCHTDDDRRFVVEMQRGDKRYLKNRMLYYASSMITTQLKIGDSYGKLMPSYVICFMNFRLKHDYNKLIYRYMVREESGELYGGQLNVLFCELPRLISKPHKEMTLVETWFDILRNMRTFVGKPGDYGERFRPIVENCLQTPISGEEKKHYLRSMITHEITSILSDEDREEAREEVRKDVARRMKSMGLPLDTITAATDLSEEQVEGL